MLERLPDGSLAEWALDPCCDHLTSVPNTFEEFPWCRTNPNFQSFPGKLSMKSAK